MLSFIRRSLGGGGLSKHLAVVVLATVGAFSVTVSAETETIDLKALAKKARPAVLLLVVSDANGKEIATGTGFLVSSDGKLITNHHVIEDAASAIAKAENGGLFPVEGVLADDPKNDLVLLKLEGKDLPFLLLGESDKIEVGTRIAVIGSPLGLEGTLSEGIVSAVREDENEGRLIQITAAISPGSSGSPVLNTSGEAIGVATALIRSGQALNFAVPVSIAKGLLVRSHSVSKLKVLGTGAAGGESTDEQILSSPEYIAVASAEKNAMHSLGRKGEDADLPGFMEMVNAAKVLVGRFPDSALAHDRLGDAYNWMDFWDDAISAYSQAVRLNPSDAVGWCSLGCCYQFKHQYKEAISALQQSVKIAPEYAYGWSHLGQAYALSGRYDDAKRVLQLLRGMKTKNADVAARMLEEAIPELVH